MQCVWAPRLPAAQGWRAGAGAHDIMNPPSLTVACSKISEVLNEKLWYNKYITVNNKPIYRQWENTGIQYIRDLLKADGSFKGIYQIRQYFNTFYITV